MFKYFIALFYNIHHVSPGTENSPTKTQIKINPVIIKTRTKPKICIWFVAEQVRGEDYRPFHLKSVSFMLFLKLITHGNISIMRYGDDFLRTKLGGKSQTYLGRHLMQNYATFYLVITLKSNNNKTMHVVILSVNLVLWKEGREGGREGKIKKNNYSNDIKVKFKNC